MNPGFFELTIILTSAAVLSVLARLLRQPTILAYLAVGVLINYLNIFDLSRFEIFELFSEMGIMLLLFLVGLEINYTSLKMVGKVSLILGLGQILFTTLGGFIISRIFGYDTLQAAYIGVALCFSSTIIIVKLLTDKKDLNSLYGKISIGFLLVQDIVAILLLVILSSAQAGQGIEITGVLLALGKALGLFVLMIWLGRKIMPVLLDKVAHSQEVLFVTSLAWVFSLAVIVKQIDFSIEIAGFLAGIALANSSEHFQVANRIRPLRDFFLMLFFVNLGSSFVFSSLSGMGPKILILSGYVLIGNPLIVIILMGLLGYKKRTGFLTGMTVAQISEFSLILMALGLKLGHINNQILAMVTAVGILTITVSTYLITYSNVIYKYVSGLLTMFERKNPHEVSMAALSVKKPIILIGFHRTGRSIAHNLDINDILVIDFDPGNIPYLEKNGFSFIFGDISDEDVYDAANCSKAKIVISTIPDLEDNLILITALKKARNRPQIIVRSETEVHAGVLYDSGADYVILPHLYSGHSLGQALANDKKKKVLEKLKERDLQVLSATAGE
ncbi:MAG: cation:proton antiporter [Candidatus Doudnabacteria bacterium]|nr:cation:proton antiporter [Candidatus Doudnabacteria bacterium]